MTDPKAFLDVMADEINAMRDEYRAEFAQQHLYAEAELPQMEIDVSGVDPADMAEAVRRAILAMEAEKLHKRGVATRGPDSVGKPFSARQKRRAEGKINPAVGLAVQFDDRTELVAVRRAIKRVSGGRTR